MSAVLVDPDWSRFDDDDYDTYDDYEDWYDRYEWQDRFEDYDAYDIDTSEPTAATDAEAGICTLCDDDIYPGDFIVWRAGGEAVHYDCII